MEPNRIRLELSANTAKRGPPPVGGRELETLCAGCTTGKLHPRLTGLSRVKLVFCSHQGYLDGHGVSMNSSVSCQQGWSSASTTFSDFHGPGNSPKRAHL